MYQTSTSQANPNTSGTNLANLGPGHRGNINFQRPPMTFSSSFTSFEMPITPPFSKSNSPATENDSFAFAKEEIKRTWYLRWLPPVSAKIMTLCGSWYMCSIVSNNTTKSILRGYLYPITLTQFQFVLNSSFCIILFACLLRFNNTYPHQIRKLFPMGSIPNLSEVKSMGTLLTPTPLIISTTLSMGMYQFVGHITSHKATSIIPVSMVHTVKALSPIMTVLINRFVFNSKYTMVTYVTLMPLILGIMLTCYNPKHLEDELLYYKSGLTYAFISMLIFVVQNISAKKSLTYTDGPKNLPLSKSRLNKKVDKLTILLFCSIIGFVFTSPFYLYLELRNPRFSLYQLTPYTIFLIVFNGFSHFLQSLLAFQILGSISPINYSIANIMKKIIIILVSFLWEKQSISYNQGYGILLTITGLYCYERWGTK